MLRILPLILGVLGTLAGGAVLTLCLALPTLTSGRTSWSEAMLGIIPAFLILALSLLLTLAGTLLMLLRKAPAQ